MNAARQPRCRAGLRVAAAVLALSPWFALSQEGFPLDGTWRGEWGAAGSDSNHVVIVMRWNGETVTGRINPGPNSIDFSNAWLEPADWGVHIEAESADGEAIRIDGTLENIGSWNRHIVGTWRQGDSSGPFRITRE